MSSSNCCFLICIQVSQEAGPVVWDSHLFQNFPQFIVIHTVKGFGIVNKAEIDVFLELSCFFDDSADVGNLICGSLVAQRLKHLPAMREIWVWSLRRKIPWRRKWQPTPVFLPGESHGRRRLVGYSPRVTKSRTQLSDFTFTFHFPLRFLKPAWISGSSRFTYCCSLAWRILSITLLACEMSALVR